MPTANARRAIISFNIAGLPYPPRARGRVREFGRLAEQTDASLINLQELHTYGLLGLLRRELRSFPYVSYRPGLLGPQAGLVTLSNRPFVANSCTTLSFQKGLLITRLDDGTVIGNVHLIANKDGDWSRENRFYPRQKAQLETVAGILKQHESAGDMILTGDFNLAKTSDLYDNFVRQGGWHDAFGDSTATTYHQEYLPQARQAQCIDYVFTKGKSVRPVEARILFADKVLIGGRMGYLSNHKGLWVRFD